MVLLWETCRTLGFELSNEQTVVMNQQPECNAHTEEHVIRTDLTKLGATVVSLVQIFLRFFFSKRTHYIVLRQRPHSTGMQSFCSSKSSMLGQSGLKQR